MAIGYATFNICRKNALSREHVLGRTRHRAQVGAGMREVTGIEKKWHFLIRNHLIWPQDGCGGQERVSS